MSDKHTLIAFLSTLGAIVVLAGMASFMLKEGKQIEALGLGGIMTGLIGVLGTFRPRGVTANVEKADTVNQGGGDAPA